MALVMVRAPNPPGSKASISPPGAVLEIAPAKVLHGAVRLQGLASSPTPETHVRVAWALSKVLPSKIRVERISNFILCIFDYPLVRWIHARFCRSFKGPNIRGKSEVSLYRGKETNES